MEDAILWADDAGGTRPLLSIRDLRLTRNAGSRYSLSIPRLDIQAGEKIAVTGESGCGKSTALDLLGMVLRPDTAGRFQFAPPGAPGQDVAACWRDGRRDRLAGLRLRHMGYVLQTGGLLPFLTVRENMELSAKVLDLPGRDGHVRDIARTLGIEHKLRAMPSALSIGERQRVAIGRALAGRPAVLLADEPTASLDPGHAGVVLDMLMDAVETYAVTLVLVTHSPDIVRSACLREYRMRAARQGEDGVTAVLTD
ncbi:MAG: ABC transporter ATP-binding protein [Solidesulfovibrio sp. DCME]|uniref:ABC transporter ATP-binding protein n=1 Tax=Solidesulfovibrio sp. DCME TaxID=3447380 RepID=UPI003D13D150